MTDLNQQWLTTQNLIRRVLSLAISGGFVAGTLRCIARPVQNRWYLQGSFRGAQITPDQNEFNKSMRKVRISFEWLFGSVTEDFKFFWLQKVLKIGLSSIGKRYRVSALLTNARSCLYKNDCWNYFDLNPPFLEEYFR